MKINKIELKNFRGIENLTIDLMGKSTILFGVNGVGKSSVLRAIDLLYANIIRIIRSSRSLAQLDVDDIMYGKSVASIKADFIFEKNYEIEYSRSIKRGEKGGRSHSNKQLQELTNFFIENYIKGSLQGNEENKKNMPIFVNYGVNRLVIDVPVRTSKMDNYTQLDAFDKAIDSKIDFRSLFTWFRYQEDIENQEKVRNNPLYKDKELEAVKTAMLAMLEGFSDIRIDRKPLAMKISKNGKSLKINQLSDGEKCTIALFGDLARRLALANPTLSNPLEGVGVVLIDELELHMHTLWQRKVLTKLNEIFPNIQFIISTHSPQVLGEVDNEFNIITLVREDDSICFNEYNSLFGWDSNVILEDIMKTDSKNSGIKQMVKNMYLTVENKKYEQAEKIADEIDELTQGHNEDTVRVRVLISRGRRNEKNQ